MKSTLSIFLQGLVIICTSVACAQHDVLAPLNYDNFIGKEFSKSIYMGRDVYKKILEKEDIEELENIRSDGCILVFGVNKINDVIQYWRIDSAPGTCMVGERPLNWNR